MNALADRLAALIEPSLTAMGYDLVRVQIDGKRQARVQIMAERHDGSGMGVEDCAALSRHISAILDVEDPIEGAYTLEVSSPGIDRPLMKPADYARFAGHVAKVELKAARENRRRFTGTIKGLEGDADSRAVVLDTGEETVSLPLAEIERGKLVLTDALLKSAKPANA
jgi:ribosome maturation factor RimP